MWNKIKDFLHGEIWRMHPRDLPRHLAFPLRVLRICIIACREFKQDRCTLHSSALTFYTLLSLVPILAMVFGIAKGFDIEEDMRSVILAKARGPIPDYTASEKQIIARVEALLGRPVADSQAAVGELQIEEQRLTRPPGAGEVGSKARLKETRELRANLDSITLDKSIADKQAQGLDWLSQVSKKALSQTKGGLIAGIGIILLFSLVIRMIGNIEETFNDIWGVKKGRGLVRKVSDYLAIIVICPLLLIFSNSLAVYIVHKLPEQISHLRVPGLSSIVLLLTGWLPIVVIWMAFAFIYLFVPNTRVRPKVALLAGIVAGTLFQIVQWLYIKFQFGVAHYSTIYGALAAAPLFLVWLQSSWLIVLLGAEISAAADSEESYEFEGDYLNVAQRFKHLLALRVTQLCVKNFVEGQHPMSIHSLAQQLETPQRLLRVILYQLVQSNVLVEIRNGGAEGDTCYQPAQEASRITIKKVLDALDTFGTQQVPIAEDRELQKIGGRLAELDALIAKSHHNIALKDL